MSDMQTLNKGESFHLNGIADDAIIDLLNLSELDEKLFQEAANFISACLFDAEKKHFKQ